MGCSKAFQSVQTLFETNSNTWDPPKLVLCPILAFYPVRTTHRTFSCTFALTSASLQQIQRWRYNKHKMRKRFRKTWIGQSFGSVMTLHLKYSDLCSRVVVKMDSNLLLISYFRYQNLTELTVCCESSYFGYFFWSLTSSMVSLLYFEISSISRCCGYWGLIFFSDSSDFFQLTANNLTTLPQQMPLYINQSLSLNLQLLALSRVPFLWIQSRLIL